MSEADDEADASAPAKAPRMKTNKVRLYISGRCSLTEVLPTAKGDELLRLGEREEQEPVKSLSDEIAARRQAATIAPSAHLASTLSSHHHRPTVGVHAQMLSARSGFVTGSYVVIAHTHVNGSLAWAGCM
jgi:hypothetical protein